ncbi:hypothetical protein PN498_27140 [Oscillatoria sp. CS-180]|uniref:hypothetical protein n=1 Tax=Oscillatoria sp. CS-180 TaxID=3021720 RepID=UPI00232B0D25|nr:hypothetical protein [Oscillatoria sp. CS-180]MDB9529693.1 hypothetical protein [Oscillatoria sp. CS-180]
MKTQPWIAVTLPMALMIGVATAPVAGAQTLVAPGDAPVVAPDGTIQAPGSLPAPSVTTTGGTWGQGTSILNGDLDSILNDQLEGLLGGDLASILGGGDLGSILGSDDLIDGILNDVLGSGDWGGESILGDILGGGILKGDLDAVLGDVLAGSILEDVLGGGGLEDILGGDLGSILTDGGWGDLEGALGGLGDLGLGGLDDLLGGGGGYSAEIDIKIPALGESLASWNTLAGEASGALISNVVGAFGSAPHIVTGALGVPDVLASQLSVFDTVMGGVENGSPGGTSQRADRFNVNPVALSETIGKEVSRAASVGFSNTLLSEAGQLAIVEEVEATDETLTDIVDLATEAQDLDVTQDVMKNLSAMAAQQSSLQVAEYGQTIQLRQQFAADAVVQAEAAEDLAALSRRQQTEPMAAAAEVIQSSSTLVLFKGAE